MLNFVPVQTGSQFSVCHLVTTEGAAVVSDANLLEQSQAPVSEIIDRERKNLVHEWYESLPLRELMHY